MFGSHKRTYLDFASATPLSPQASEAMHKAERSYGNPGSVHSEGVEARRALDAARASIAEEVGAKAGQIIFTSGLTESNNLAVLGLARAIELTERSLEETHWITTSIEHSSILEVFADVERRGGTVAHLEPDERGLISRAALERSLKPSTVLVSIGWANNEIGVVQDLSALSRTVRESAPQALFHSDAGQAPLYRFPHVHTLGMDMVSLGSGKLYGPRGIGCLYVDDPSRLSAHMLGGGQEKGLRAGTEEVSLASGFAAALALIGKERREEAQRLEILRDALASDIEDRIPGILRNGDAKHVLPHMLNISIPDVHAEYLVLALDREGFALSTRSACNTNEARSHVVAALGGESWRAENTLRISFGRGTTAKDIGRFTEALVRLTKAIQGR
jgi:cysteine desulfurase